MAWLRAVRTLNPINASCSAYPFPIPSEGLVTTAQALLPTSRERTTVFDRVFGLPLPLPDFPHTLSTGRMSLREDNLTNNVS